LGGLPSPEEAEGIWTDIWYQEAHHSTAIEGNTLVRKQVELLLKEGRVVGDKELSEYLVVQGYADAAKWVYGQALTPGNWSTGALLSMPEVRHVHELMISPAWKVAPHPEASDQEGPGQWRRHEIQPFSSGMELPSWTEIQARMTDWLDDVNALRVHGVPHAPWAQASVSELLSPAVARAARPSPPPTEAAPIAESVARVHATFERIHPFLDGNGRTGRLLTNLILVRLGYPPVIVQKRERSFYLSALDRADRGDVGPLGELFARAILDNLNRFILPAVAGPAKLVPLEALATPKLKVDTLRKAAERGRLRATRAPNGTWRSSRIWVDEYVSRRWIRGKDRAAVPAASAET
jgi:Fic family protein